jgi:hypothetical protein
MKNKHIQYGVFAIIVLIVAAYFYQQQSDVPLTRGYTDLERTGDECDLIAAKAAMKLPEALPFQKLEKAARQTRVLETCMHDRGYIENPDWDKFAAPIAQLNAKNRQISENEAFETLRREKVKTFAITKGEPSYWMLRPSEQHTPS